MKDSFVKRIKPAGFAALLILAIAFFLCLGQPRNPTFQLFCFTLAMILVSVISTFLRRTKLHAVMHLPRYATVDEPLDYSIHVKNIGSKKITSLSLRQNLPDPRPLYADFKKYPEPDEEQRNPFDRTMLYYRWQWLLNRSLAFKAKETHDPFDLAPNESKKVSMQLYPRIRGKIILSDVRALLPDPFFLFQKNSQIQTELKQIIVLPKRYAIPSIELTGSGAFQMGGEESSQKIGSSGEFLCLREYRPGDPLRQIHWKSWAHTGRPMVRESEDPFYPRYALVIDTYPSSQSPVVFEEILSVAASLILGLTRGNTLLDLIFMAGEAHTLNAGQGMEKSDKLLEILASCLIEPEIQLELLSQSVLKHREKISCCILILNSWDEDRKLFIQSLQKHSFNIIPLILGEGAAPDQVHGLWLESGKIPRDLLGLPSFLRSSISMNRNHAR